MRKKPFTISVRTFWLLNIFLIIAGVALTVALVLATINSRSTYYSGSGSEIISEVTTSELSEEVSEDKIP